MITRINSAALFYALTFAFFVASLFASFQLFHATTALAMTTAPNDPTYSVYLEKNISDNKIPNPYTADQFKFHIVGTSATGTAIDTTVQLDFFTPDTANKTIQLPIGSYTISEVGPNDFVPADWTVQWSGFTCNGGNGEIRPSTLKVTNDETANTCRADNQWRGKEDNGDGGSTTTPKTGKLLVSKVIVGTTTVSASKFSFSYTGLTSGGGTFEVDGKNALTLATGTYSVTETAAAGYTTTYNNCANIVVHADATSTCTITNTLITNGGGGGDNVDGCTDRTANNYNPAATKDDGSCTYDNGGGDNSLCAIGDNLLGNGSFETPVGNDAAGWDIFASGTAGLQWMVQWVSAFVGAPATANIELHHGVNGWLANNGSQYAELDSDWGGPSSPQTGEEASTRISQTVATVPGSTYKLTFDFSPRPDTNTADNALQVLLGGTLTDTLTADGSANSNTHWNSHTYTFVATTTSTEIAFADAGTPNSSGTFIDNAKLCFVRDNNGGGGDGDKPKYLVFGNVWHDKNANTVWEMDQPNPGDDEPDLSGWTVTITNGSTTYSTTTDATGHYYFYVPAGTWTINEVVQNDWTKTFPVVNGHVVHVLDESAQAESKSFFAMVMDHIVPTAYAAAVTTYGPYDFGNDYTPCTSNCGGGSNGGCTSNCGGGGNGVKIELGHGGNGNGNNDGNNDGNGPVPQVLGAATDVMPVGAPNTGAGGTSPIGVQLPSLLAVLGSRKTLRVVYGKAV